MKIPLLLSLALLTLPVRAAAADYQAVPDWLKLPSDRSQLGNQHGDVAVSSAGEIYVSTKDPTAGVMVFAADGRYLRKVPGAPDDFHGFVIRRDATGEFIYGSRETAQSIVKLALDGRKVLEIPATVIPDRFKIEGPKTRKNEQGAVVPHPMAGKRYVRFTTMDVAANGDLFVTDGYASDYIHRFDRTGKYLTSFGGKGAPYNFKTLHKIAIDTRFTPARIIGCDRANLRVVHLSLDGEFLGVIATDMLLPAAVAIHGDYAAIGELRGRVTILDRAGKVVARLGTNANTDEIGVNRTEPSRWRPGIVTAPHGVAFNERGDLFVSEYSLFGRVHRFNRK